MIDCTKERSYVSLSQKMFTIDLIKKHNVRDLCRVPQ